MSQTCEWGECRNPAAFIGTMPRYPDNLYACERHQRAMFGTLAVDTAKWGPKLRAEDYQSLRNRWGSYERIVGTQEGSKRV